MVLQTLKAWTMVLPEGFLDGFADTEGLDDGLAEGFLDGLADKEGRADGEGEVFLFFFFFFLRIRLILRYKLFSALA